MTKAEAIDNFRFFNEGDYITREMEESADIVLNLIQTQQEEIEKLKSMLKISDITAKCDVELIEELRAEIEKKDAVINEMAGEIIRILYYCDGKVGKYKTPYVEESISKTYENIKKYFINKVEKER